MASKKFKHEELTLKINVVGQNHLMQLFHKNALQAEMDLTTCGNTNKVVKEFRYSMELDFDNKKQFDDLKDLMKAMSDALQDIEAI